MARLEPVTGGEAGEQDARLARLLREGLVRPRRKGPARAIFSGQPPRANATASIVDALIEERRNGR